MNEQQSDEFITALSVRLDQVPDAPFKYDGMWTNPNVPPVYNAPEPRRELGLVSALGFAAFLTVVVTVVQVVHWVASW